MAIKNNLKKKSQKHYKQNTILNNLYKINEKH